MVMVVISYGSLLILFLVVLMIVVVFIGVLMIVFGFGVVFVLSGNWVCEVLVVMLFMVLWLLFKFFLVIVCRLLFDLFKVVR